MIKISNASFEYSGIPVFEDIDLELMKGEVLCLFGPNGCGKTTLIDNILGHLHLKTGNTYDRREKTERIQQARSRKKNRVCPADP